MRAVLFLLAVWGGASVFAQSGQTICINGKCYRVTNSASGWNASPRTASAWTQPPVSSTVVSERVVTDVPVQARSLARSAPLAHHAWGLMTALARVTGTDRVLRCDGDGTRLDFANADVVLLRSRPAVISTLVPRLAKLRRGARVVSYGFDIPDQCTTQHSIDGHELFLWIVGDEKPAAVNTPDWLRGA
ncbi:MAG: hypothetical protein AAFX06_24120 [Planctomycetota bacterium]